MFVYRGVFREPEFGIRILAYVADTQGGMAIDDALLKNFGMDAKQLGASMLTHARN